MRTLSVRRARLSWLLLYLVVAALIVTACAGQKTPARETATPTPTASVPPGATADPGAKGTGGPGTPAASPPASLTLIIWGPDSMAPGPESPGGAVLAAQVDEFVKAHAGWQVHYVRKKPYGSGGLVHFLRSASSVARESLPDLVLLDMSEIGLLASNSLLQPLDSVLGSEIISDLAPFARQAGQIGERLVAVQYEADLRLLAYNSAVIETPPTSWTDILASKATYLLPIGSSEGAVRDAFLPLYLASGGKLTDRDGRPDLDRTVVAAILEAYRSARQANLLPATGFDLESASDCWPAYLTGGATMTPQAALTNVNTWDYARDRTRLAKTLLAPLPTLSGAPASMSNGWGWAVITRDAKQQAAAVAFLRWIMRPEAMASWSQVTYHLPTRRSALSLLAVDPEYLQLLQRVMEVAVPQPMEPMYGLACEALRPAIENVARGNLSPQAAAAEAADRMRASQEQSQPQPGSQR